MGRDSWASSARRLLGDLGRRGRCAQEAEVERPARSAEMADAWGGTAGGLNTLTGAGQVVWLGAEGTARSIFVFKRKGSQVLSGIKLDAGGVSIRLLHVALLVRPTRCTLCTHGLCAYLPSNCRCSPPPPLPSRRLSHKAPRSTPHVHRRAHGRVRISRSPPLMPRADALLHLTFAYSPSMPWQTTHKCHLFWMVAIQSSAPALRPAGVRACQLILRSDTLDSGTHIFFKKSRFPILGGVI